MKWTERDLQQYREEVCISNPCNSGCELYSCTKTKEEIDECCDILFNELLDDAECEWDGEDQVCS